MEHITAAGNVEVPAFLALKQLGFALERKLISATSEMWIATKGDYSLSAPSTLEILGLYTMRATRGTVWKATDVEIDSYLGTYYPMALEEKE